MKAERKGTGTKGALLLLCKLVDIDRAIRTLLPKEHHAVLIHGQLGYTVRDAAKILGVGKSTVDDHYAKGIASMTSYLNGAT